MTERFRYRAVLFDMDNTLLKSAIDFPRIKRDVFSLLVDAGLFGEHVPLSDHTIATLIEAARRTAGWNAELETAVWERVARGEREGMAGAGLEPHVRETLERLHGRLRLTVLTNNAREAALEALARTGILAYFDHVAGREQMEALKPSPSGVRRLLGLYPDIAPKEWLAVGDSWIDGQAAREAGIAFLAYNANMEALARRNIPAIGRISSMSELFGYLR
jgi:phosphoglycolate phosphatase